MPSSISQWLTPSRSRKRNRQSGLTLIEVIVAMLILMMTAGSVLGSLILSRRFTEEAIRQNIALNAVQGYLEQIKAISWGADWDAQLPLSSATGGAIGIINTMKDAGAGDDLQVSCLPVPSSFTTAPTGATPTLKTITVNGATSVTMPINIWVWIEAKPTALDPKTKLKAITVIYTWTSGTGSIPKTYVGSVRTMCAQVPTI